MIIVGAHTPNLDLFHLRIDPNYQVFLCKILVPSPLRCCFNLFLRRFGVIEYISSQFSCQNVTFVLVHVDDGTPFLVSKEMFVDILINLVLPIIDPGPNELLSIGLERPNQLNFTIDFIYEEILIKHLVCPLQLDPETSRLDLIIVRSVERVNLPSLRLFHHLRHLAIGQSFTLDHVINI